MKFDENVKKIEEIIGYRFRDKSLLRQAFTRTSYCNEHGGYQSNEVLEFFGDSVLSAAIITLLLREHTERYAHGIKTPLSEGDFSNVKSKLSDKKNLSESTARLGLEEFLLMGEGDEKLGIKNEPSVMEDLFESIIGAIYIDSGENMAAVLPAVSRMLDVKTYLDGGATPMQSFKNALQEWCADRQHRRGAPVYKTLSESGPDHKKTFERGCYIDGRLCGVGTGKNTKLADSAAAEAALGVLLSEFEKENKPCGVPVMQRLREIAKERHRPGPEFRDLGETEASSERRREFSVECRFLDKTAKGKGVGRREAKDAAAEAILSLIREEGEKKRRSTPRPGARRHKPTVKR